MAMTEPLFKDIIYQNENYQVQIVRHEDMAFDSYGIVNRTTGVIEGIQTILSQAKSYCDEFDRWLREPQKGQKNPFESIGA